MIAEFNRKANVLKYILFSCLSFLISITATLSIADDTSVEKKDGEDFFLNDSSLDDSVFSDEDLFIEENIEKEDSWLSFFRYSGLLSHKTSYSYLHKGVDITGSKSKLNLKLSVSPSDSFWKLKFNWVGFYDSAYHIQGRSSFTKDTLDTYETDSEFKELYLDVDFTNWLNLRVGRQFFSWGETQISQISDVGNPRNFRELGLQDLDSIRQSVSASKLTFFGNNWEYNLIAIHEMRQHELSTDGSEFDPYITIRSNQVIIDNEIDLADSLSNTEFLTRLFFSGHLGDISLYAANVYEDLPILDLTSVDINTGVVHFTPVYERTNVYGLFGNVVSSSFLFKYDLARKTGMPVIRSSDNIFNQINSNPFNVQSFETKSIDQWMLGVEYSGINETSVVFEYSGQYIEDHHDDLADEESSHKVSLYVSHDMLHDTLLPTFWWSYDFTERTNLFKIESSYAYTDEIKLILGISGFLVGDKDSFYHPYRNNDRLYFALEYGF